MEAIKKALKNSPYVRVGLISGLMLLITLCVLIQGGFELSVSAGAPDISDFSLNAPKYVNSAGFDDASVTTSFTLSNTADATGATVEFECGDNSVSKSITSPSDMDYDIKCDLNELLDKPESDTQDITVKCTVTVNHTQGSRVKKEGSVSLTYMNVKPQINDLSVTYTPTNGYVNKATTARISCNVVTTGGCKLETTPKVTIGVYSADMTKDGNRYTAEIPFAMFADKDISAYDVKITNVTDAAGNTADSASTELEVTEQFDFSEIRIEDITISPSDYSTDWHIDTDEFVFTFKVSTVDCEIDTNKTYVECGSTKKKASSSGDVYTARFDAGELCEGKSTDGTAEVAVTFSTASNKSSTFKVDKEYLIKYDGSRPNVTVETDRPALTDASPKYYALGTTLSIAVTSDGPSGLDLDSVSVTARLGDKELTGIPSDIANGRKYSFTIPTSLSEGAVENIRYSYSASTVAGKPTASSDVLFGKVDRVKPVITGITGETKELGFIGGANGTTLSFTVADGESGIDAESVKVTVNGKKNDIDDHFKPNVTLEQNGSAAFLLNTAEIQNWDAGTLSYTVAVSDKSGNSNTATQHFSCDIDSEAPMLVDCKDDQGEFFFFLYSECTVTINVTDNKSGIKKVEYRKRYDGQWVGSDQWKDMYLYSNNPDHTEASYQAKFKVNLAFESGYKFNYEFRLTDNVGNQSTVTRDGKIVGDGKGPSVSDLSLYADDNRAYVASGDKVYASFTAADDYSGVDNDSVYVTFTGNKRVQAEYDEATGKFIAGVSYDGLPDLTKITVDSISIKDIAGNEISYNRQQLSCSGEIHFLEQISVSNISFVRSKPLSGPNVAKNGDELTLSFNTNHAIIQKQVLIDGVEVSLDEKIYTHSNTYKYTAVATVAGNTADGDAIPFSVTIGDEAGNEDYTFTNSSVDDVIYYAPIAVSNQEMITSGNNRSFFKDDDEIRISFSTQHEVYLDSGSKIAGKLLTLGLTPCADAPLTYEIVSKIDKDSIDDEEKISAVINIIDLAGNTATVDFRNTGLVYYAPINAKVSIRSDSRDNRYVGNGGKVTVTVEANHPVSVKSTRIAGRKASTPKTARVFTTSYTIPANESHLKEGKLSLALVLTDEAGNERIINQVTDTSSVTYDKSRPTIGVSPIFSGFTSDGVSYTFTFRDNNLYGGGISVKVNGNERMTSSDRSSAYGDSFDKTVALNDEGDYDILVTCADRAGNLAQSKSFRLSIDKTVPTISTSVTLSTDTVPVFMKGFVIADYLEITEEHIKDIICKVSDSSGSKSWDISEPIVTDGKKTISVIVNDMADNTSNALTFDVYIDATAPTISVEELITQVPLSADTSDTFEGAMTLDIGCVGSTVSSAYADEFKTLKLLSSDGSVYHDFLASGSSDRYTLELDKFGDYVLVLEAVDHAGGDATTIGNTTGELHYAFTYRDKSFLRKYYENKFLFYGSIAVLLGAIALVLVLYLRKKNAPITESI